MGSSWSEYNDDLHLETRLDAVEFCTGLLSNEFFIALKLKSKKRVTDAGLWYVTRLWEHISRKTRYNRELELSIYFQGSQSFHCECEDAVIIVNRGYKFELACFLKVWIYVFPLTESSSSKSKKKGKPLKFDVIIDAGEFLDSPDQFYMWKYSPMGIWAYIIGKFALFFPIYANNCPSLVLLSAPSCYDKKKFSVPVSFAWKIK